MGRTQVAVAMLATLALVLAAGCGSKKASSPPTTTAGTTTTATTTSGGGGYGGGGGSTSKPSFASAKNCAQLASLASKVTQSVAPGSGSANLKSEADAMDALANAAPDAIKADFKTFAEAFKDFAKVYADAGLKAGQTPTAPQIAKLSAAGQKLSTPKIQAAIQHLSSWAQKNCGISSTSP